MMSSDLWSERNPKRQRIMIVMADENLMDQIEKSNNISLLKELALPSEANINQTFNKQNKIEASPKKTKTKDACLVCVVCGSSATGYNFGAIVCESCKAFFRRNARKDPRKFYCNKIGQCQITLETRRDCSACRLAKCFNSGMQCDRLSTAEQKAAKRHQIEENRNLASKSISQTDEEEIRLYPSIFLDDFPLSIDTDILLTDFTDFLSSEPQQTLLSREDFERIEAISRFYQNRIECAAREGLPWNPTKHTKTILEVLNSTSIQVMRLLSFFKQIPEFQQLNIDDQVTLIKCNLLTINGINSALAYNDQTHQLLETDSDAPRNIQYFRVLHGYKTSSEISKIFASFLTIAKYDPKIIQMALIILLFTKSFSIKNNPDEPILNDTMSAYRAQNHFTELLWKYLEATHGYNKAVSLFSQFVLHTISWQTIQEQIRNDVLRILAPEDVDQLVPIVKLLLNIS